MPYSRSGFQRQNRRPAVPSPNSLQQAQGTQTAYTLLRDDILANDAEALAEDTVYAYTNALRKVRWPGCGGRCTIGMWRMLSRHVVVARK
ncbi:MAG: hypothetical protein IJX45_03520 [Spirochaetaceae bacterium]|nr:hypothetical protein [Spirochaetaceae bacterium]